MRTIVVVSMLLLAGCASLEDLKTEPQADYCRHAGNLTTALAPHERAGHMLTAVERAIDTGIERKFIRPQYRDMILTNKIAVGMYECEVIAAWGTPSQKNPVTSMGRPLEQWVWTDYRWSNNLVSFDGGIVDSIKN